MTNQETSVANWFSTTLSSSVTNSTLTFPVDSIGALTSPAYIIIEPDNASKREVILADGTWGASSFVASGLASRGLSGSASGAQSHDAGSVVEVRPLAQHIEDLNDRTDAHAHGGGSDGAQVDHGGLVGIGDDDHTQYLNNTRHDDTTRHPVSVLGSDGSGLGLRDTVEFTSSGTFDKASYPWLRAIRVRVWGGGGAAGGCAATGAGESAASGGGGGGGYAEAVVLASALSASETVTVGSGGATTATGNVNGASGGSSSFGAHAVVQGGAGGTGSAATSATLRNKGGNGGTGTAGDVQTRGDDGGWGHVISAEHLLSATGGGTSLAGNTVPGNNSGGEAGEFPGGGGSGTTSAASQSARGGLAGADGLVVVELYA